MRVCEHMYVWDDVWLQAAGEWGGVGWDGVGWGEGGGVKRRPTGRRSETSTHPL